MNVRPVLAVIPLLLVACPWGDRAATVRVDGVTYSPGCGHGIPEAALGERLPIDTDEPWRYEEARTVRGFDQQEVIALRYPVDTDHCDDPWNGVVARGLGAARRDALHAALDRAFTVPPPPGEDIAEPSGLLVYPRRASDEATGQQDIDEESDENPSVDEVDLYAADPSTGAAWRLTDVPGAEFGLVASPDGTRLLFRRRWLEGKKIDRRLRSDISIIDLRTRNIRTLIPCQERGCLESGFTWSPDGGRIAYVSADSVVVISADGSDVVPVCRLTACGPAPGELAWSPDGTALAWADTGIPWTATNDEVPIPWPEEDTQEEAQVRWADDPAVDGTAASEQPSIRVADLAAGTIRQLAPGCHPRCLDQMPVWSPDGEALAFPRTKLDLDGIPIDRRVVVARATDAAIERMYHCGVKCRLPWPRDGHDIVLIEDGTIQISATGAHAHRELSLSAAARAVWSPDGGYLGVVVGTGADQPAEIVVVRQNGEDERRLDRGPTWDTCCAIAWLPQTAASLGLPPNGAG